MIISVVAQWAHIFEISLPYFCISKMCGFYWATMYMARAIQTVYSCVYRHIRRK